MFTLGKRRAFPSPEPRSVVQDTCPLLSVTPCRLVNKRRDFVSYRDSLLTWFVDIYGYFLLNIFMHPVVVT
ncbi:unnamed protein product [Schistosoma mattheei]|uniref:Uncharacterized protein n=1 Tax=Schistosoma mattheei TaxID=31246 RepID=A0A3P8K6W4_9TREM|nr:unnamed protein product [Schistosoma mattheei]